jgi:hypothetical protein
MTLTTDEKRKVVIRHYEHSYAVKFSRPLDEKTINFLYDEILKLQESITRESDRVKKAPRPIRLVVSNTGGNRTARAYPPKTGRTSS